MFKPVHFYVVFNPMLNDNNIYPSQAHEFYHQLKGKVNSGEMEKSFMYWGKLKVNETHQDPVAQAKDIISLNKSYGEDTHLYITDYHHFWVAKISDVYEEVHGPENTLPFYDGKEVDLWFKITDMDLLSAEFEETTCYLKQLYVDNQFAEQKVASLNPYVGGLSFPLAVQDHTDEKYFKNYFAEDGLRVKRSNALIENPKGSGDMSLQMKSFVLPPHIYSKLSHLVKTELLAVETSLAKRDDSNEATSNMTHSYLRILESIMNDTIGNLLKDYLGTNLYISNSGDRFYDHKNEHNLLLNQFEGKISIGAFTTLVEDVSHFGNLSLKFFEDDHPQLIRYFMEHLKPFIGKYELAGKRDFLKNKQNLTLNKQEAFLIRNEILGVGCEGIINKLIRFTVLHEPEEILKNIA